MPNKLVLVVRTDLGMGRGKIAAQVAHAAVSAAVAGLGQPRLRRWLEDGQPKVVLRAAGEEELTEVAGRAAQAGLAVELISDAGRTQVPTGTLTACAIGPDEEEAIDAVTGTLLLL